MGERWLWAIGCVVSAWLLAVNVWPLWSRRKGRASGEWRGDVSGWGTAREGDDDGDA